MQMVQMGLSTEFETTRLFCVGLPREFTNKKQDYVRRSSVFSHKAKEKNRPRLYITLFSESWPRRDGRD
jgi:hypothetical protein